MSNIAGARLAAFALILLVAFFSDTIEGFHVIITGICCWFFPVTSLYFLGVFWYLDGEIPRAGGIFAQMFVWFTITLVFTIEILLLQGGVGRTKIM